MKELKYNLRCLFSRKELYLVFIGLLVVNLFHILMVIDYNSNWNLVYENEYRAEYLYILNNFNVSLNSIIVLLFPVLAATTFSDASFVENKNKTDNLLYLRLNRKKLILTRFLLVIVVVFVLCFLSFLLNYLSLAYIYGSGNALTDVQSPAFYLRTTASAFLDSIRVSNVQLFTVLTIGHVSFLLSLLAGLAYSLSFFVKQKVLIYVLPLLLIIGIEFFLSLFDLVSYSVIAQLQLSSAFTLQHAIVTYIALPVVSLILLFFPLRQKDVL